MYISYVGIPVCQYCSDTVHGRQAKWSVLSSQAHYASGHRYILLNWAQEESEWILVRPSCSQRTSGTDCLVADGRIGERSSNSSPQLSVCITWQLDSRPQLDVCYTIVYKQSRECVSSTETFCHTAWLEESEYTSRLMALNWVQFSQRGIKNAP